MAILFSIPVIFTEKNIESILIIIIFMFSSRERYKSSNKINFAEYDTGQKKKIRLPGKIMINYSAMI